MGGAVFVRVLMKAVLYCSIRRLPATILAAFLVVCLAGCRGTDVQPEYDVIDPPTRQITLEEDLRLGVDEPLFGYVGSVEADAAGVIYVAEGRDPANIYRFDPSGALVGNLGSMGEGPGEYQGLGIIMLGRDSIVVWDSRVDRMITYEADGSHRRTGPRISTGNPTSVSILGKTDGGYFAVETPYFTTGMTNDDVGDVSYRMLYPDGSVGDVLWTSGLSEYLLWSEANSMSVSSRPFGRRTTCAALADQFYCAWTESLELHGFTASGDTLPPFRIQYTPIPVTAAERQEAVARVSDIFIDQLSIPDTQPALDGMTADDRGRLWLKVRLEPGDEVANYWVFDPADGSIVSTRVEGNVTIRSVRDGHAYAVLLTPEGESLVVRYRILE
jgi:hypothetical protein